MTLRAYRQGVSRPLVRARWGHRSGHSCDYCRAPRARLWRERAPRTEDWG